MSLKEDMSERYTDMFCNDFFTWATGEQFAKGISRKDIQNAFEKGWESYESNNPLEAINKDLLEENCKLRAREINSSLRAYDGLAKKYDNARDVIKMCVEGLEVQYGQSFWDTPLGTRLGKRLIEIGEV